MARAASSSDRHKSGDSSKKKSDKAASSSTPKRVPANGKKKAAGPSESIPPTGTAQRVLKRKPPVGDSEPEDSSSEEEAPPKKKKRRNVSPARKAKDAQKQKQKKKSKEDAWVDEQDPEPEAEAEAENEEIPKRDTLEWHKWNLPRVRARWSSKQYQHFKDEIEVIYDDSKKKFYHRFTCKRTGSTQVRPIGFSGGSNLLNHVKNCDAAEKAKQGKPVQPKITNKIPRKFCKGMFRFKLLNWATRRHRPDAIIEDEELIDVFTYLNPDAKPPSCQTLRRDVHEAFKMTREELKKLLEEHEGRFNLIFDCWTSGNGHEFLGLLLTFIHDGKLFVVVLDMIEMTVAHTGKNLAKAVFDLLNEFGIADRTLGHTGDNASNNDTMLDKLDDLYRAFETSIAGRDTQIRCFGHILNLVYHAICSQFESPKKKKQSKATEEESAEDVDEWEDDFEDDEMDADDERNEAATKQRLEMEKEELETLWAESARTPMEEPTEDEVKVGKSAMHKILKIGHRCAHKGPLQKALKRYCKLRNIKAKKMIKRVPTRWNTMYGIVDRAIKLKKAINSLCLSPDQNAHPRPTRRLKRLLLGEPEWQILEALLPILKALQKATVKMSTSRYPMLHAVIPEMDNLNQKLERAFNEQSRPPVIRRAIQRGLIVLDKYYSLTDESVMWKTAMLLHPDYRRQWFVKSKWEDTWTDQAIRDARKIWMDHYRPLVRQPAPVQTHVHDDNNLPSEDENEPHTTDVDPFEEFVMGARTTDDPIAFWWGKTAPPRSSTITPVQALARMALDFLSAPATSTDVERLFSHSGLVVAKRRHNLAPQSIRESTVLGQWLSVLGLVPVKAIAQKLHHKSSRRRHDLLSDSEWSSSDDGEGMDVDVSDDVEADGAGEPMEVDDDSEEEEADN